MPPGFPKIGILHVNKRFAKAQYREYNYAEVVPHWITIRDYWRMLSDRKTFKPVVQARPQAEKVLPDKRVSSLQSVS
jgi:hypothetical protein